MATKFDARQTISRDLLQRIATVAGTPLDALLRSLNAETTPPFNLSATTTPSLTVNVGSAKVVNPITGSNRTVAAIGADTPTLTSGTITFPATVNNVVTLSPGNNITLTMGANEYLKATIYYDSDDKLNLLFGAAGATEALATSLSAPDGTLAIGYVVVRSISSNIQNITNSNIYQFVGVGGAGGSGNANSFLLELQDRLGSSYFQCFTPNVFAMDAATKIDGASTGSYDLTNQVYSLPTIANQLVSTQSYDNTFLNNLSDNVQTELQVQWGTRDPLAVYEVSRNGGADFTPIVMSRVGESSKDRGVAVFPEPVTIASLVTYDVANADAQDALNATTQQQLAISFVVPANTKWRTRTLRAFVNKLGSPLGFVSGQVVKDSAGSPSVSTLDIMVSTAQQSVAAIGSGDQDLDFTITQPLPPGTYWLLLRTDAAYKASFVAATTELRWRTDASSPAYAGEYKTFDGTTWATSTSDATFLIQGIIYDLRVRIISGTAAVALLGYGVFYEEDTLTLPADQEEYQSFDVNGDLNTQSFVVTNFNVSPKTLKIYETRTNTVFRFPKFAVNGNTVVFPPGTFLSVGNRFTLIFEQSPLKQGYVTDKLSAVLATNGLGSSDPNFDFSSAGKGPVMRRPDGVLRMLRLDNNDNIVIESFP